LNLFGRIVLVTVPDRIDHCLFQSQPDAENISVGIAKGGHGSGYLLQDVRHLFDSGNASPLPTFVPSHVLFLHCASPWRTDILLSAQARRFGCFLLPTGKFGPEDMDLIWGVKSEPNTISGYIHDRNGDAVIDNHLLTGLPAQNKHVTLP